MTRYAAAVVVAIAILPPLGAQPVEAQTLAVFTKSQGNPVARSIRLGVEKFARGEKVMVFNFIPTSADNVAQQTALVEEAVRSKPDAVVFTPTDAKALVPAVAKLAAAKIPIINVNDRLAGGNVTAFVGTDDQALARQTARVLLKAMGGAGNVVILEGTPKSPSAMARTRGFNEALKEFPKVTLLASQAANYARKSAVDVMNGLVRKHPQIDGVLAANDPMAVGALDALGAVKRKALVVGINAGRDVIDLIKSGVMLASGDYNGFAEGCVAAALAIRALRKEAVPRELIVRTVVVDKSNLGPYEIPIEQRNCPTVEAAMGK
jgi:ribose transport system substrate-binding protein